jgi:hypothetical protein
MKTIFEASSGLEAHMIVNLLQQEGIDSRVDGEYLQGGIGELQAINIVRVLVEESDYRRAKSIIDAWDSAQVESTPIRASASKNKGIGVGLLFGVVIGTGLTFWAYNSLITKDGIDYNKDGILDERWLYRDNRLSIIDTDRDLDGTIDVVHHFNRKGIIYKTEADENFDGVFETVYKYRRGNTYIGESDVDQDGEIDMVARYQNGVISEVEIFSSDMATPVKLQKYHANKLVAAEYDSNRDGVYDVKYEYDFFEELKKKSNNTLNQKGVKNTPPG